MTDVSDSFARSAGPLGSNWTPWSWTGGAGSQSAAIASSGVVKAPSAGKTSGDYWNADTFLANQYSQATIGVVPNTNEWVAVTVRNKGTGQGYMLLWFNGSVMLFDQGTDDSPPTLASAVASLVSGDVLRVEIVGYAVKAKINGATVLTYSDISNKNWSSGSPGLALFGTSGTITHWEGGDIPTPATSSARSSLFAGADPQGESGYTVVVEAQPSTYSAVISTTEDGTLKEISYYSPPAGTASGVLPTKIGVFEPKNNTPLLEVDTPVWSGLELSGWISAPVPDFPIAAGVQYYIATAAVSAGMAQGFLFGGTTDWMPATSDDGRISMPSDVVITGAAPNGPANPYVNNAPGAFAYPATAAPAGGLNWLVDPIIQFGAEGPLNISDQALPVAVKLRSYAATLVADGGSGGNSWAIIAGALPAGLTMASNGHISGTPTALGTSTFTVEVTDSSSATDSAPMSITVSDVLVSHTGSSGEVDTYSVTSGINSTGGTGVEDMRVLQPVSPSSDRPHAFLWMLPVSPHQDTTFGDAIATAQGLGIHDEYNLTCLLPAFPMDPWYIDSDTDSHIQNDSYIMALVAWAEANLATTGHEKHYLIGFSKSGFGGQELFWHHQNVFEAVASWDAAADYTTLSPDQYDGAASIGSQANLTANKLYDPNLSAWRDEGNTSVVNRIWLGAGINLIAQTSDYSGRLAAAGIQHTYVEVVTDSHNWAPTPGWVGPAVAAMLGSPSSTTKKTYSIFGLGALPAGSAVTTAGAVRSNGVYFTVTEPCAFEGFDVHCPGTESNLAGANYSGSLYTAASYTATVLASTVVANTPGAGTFIAGAWNHIPCAPVELEPGTIYVASVAVPGSFDFLLDYWHSDKALGGANGRTSGPIVVPNAGPSTAETRNQQPHGAGAAFPAVGGGAWFGMDIKVTTPATASLLMAGSII